MKMKSKFFGFSAKLALAILAVGATFASCYDSENGDVTKPYKAPGAVYSFVGTITNNITGTAVSGATVTLTGAATGTATADANGVYQIVLKAAEGAGFAGGAVTVTVAAATNYATASATIDVTKLDAGQAATYYKNVVVNYTAFLPEGLKVTTHSNTTNSDVILSGENGENIGLDIMNDTAEPLYIKRNFVVAAGITAESNTPGVYPWASSKAISGDILAAVKAYVTAELGGKEPTEKFGKETQTFSILVAPMSALKKVTISYSFENKEFNFTYGAEKITVRTKSIVRVSFDYEETSFSHYHGHGHGHGHGGDLNAGGGIFE